MALELDRLEEDILDALTINLTEADKIPEVMTPLGDYAMALSAAIDKYVRDIAISVSVSGVESGSDTGRANVTVE
jgi:hypothetical protein|tara:strand:+ start:1073 stop:1297 length:225 start_codon:yes stop_codon:yes gene_type:complete